MRNLVKFATELAPGILFSMLCAAAGMLIAWFLKSALDFSWLEPLVLSLLLGILIRNTVGYPQQCAAGLKFATKQVLEFGVVLLGASVNLAVLASSGFTLLLASTVIIVSVIAFSTWLGTRLGLRREAAMLIGIGNGICGNSAIAAVAPTIGAKPEDIAVSIGFTAIISIFVVIGLPLVAQFFDMSDHQYGALAGLVVYAVPQVLAATFPVSPESVAIGTLAKLTRVMHLAPVCVYFSWRQGRHAGIGNRWRNFLPWFMQGFFLLAILRTFGVVSDDISNLLRETGRLMTIASMGAIGLNVDLRELSKSGLQVVLTVLASMALIFVLAFVATTFL